jgi:hypothetical protein
MMPANRPSPANAIEALTYLMTSLIQDTVYEYVNHPDLLKDSPWLQHIAKSKEFLLLVAIHAQCHVKKVGACSSLWHLQTLQTSGITLQVFEEDRPPTQREQLSSIQGQLKHLSAAHVPPAAADASTSAAAPTPATGMDRHLLLKYVAVASQPVTKVAPALQQALPSSRKAAKSASSVQYLTDIDSLADLMQEWEQGRCGRTALSLQTAADRTGNSNLQKRISEVKSIVSCMQVLHFLACSELLKRGMPVVPILPWAKAFQCEVEKALGGRRQLSGYLKWLPDKYPQPWAIGLQLRPGMTVSAAIQAYQLTPGTPTPLKAPAQTTDGQVATGSGVKRRLDLGGSPPGAWHLLCHVCTTL